MRVEAKIWKRGRAWIAESKALCVVTEGRSRQDAAYMLCDAVNGLMKAYNIEADVDVVDTTETYVESSPAALLAFILRQHRSATGTSLAKASKKLGQGSRNSIARYESGRADPTASKIQELLDAVAPGLALRIG